MSFFVGGGLVNLNTGSFSKDDFSQGAEYQVFLGVFLMFLAFSIVKYGRNFILVLSNHRNTKNVGKVFYTPPTFIN